MFPTPAFEFLQFDKTAGIAGVCAKALALATGKCGSCATRRFGDAKYVDRFTFRKLRVALRGKRRGVVTTDGEVTRMTPPLVFQVADAPLLLMVPVPVPAPAHWAEVA
jgi:hypothetical protein